MRPRATEGAGEIERGAVPITGRTYTNPVYEGYLGDPFVLKHNGEYYAYGTVPLGELAVPVLRSRDLLDWSPAGNALVMPEGTFEALWAPEVAYDNGTFYMYFSAGGAEGEGHRLRVATATRPTGPFEDAGRVLTPEEPFSIDAHPFRDAEGQWYLYYCRDFLDPDEEGRVGTGIVVDRLVGMTRLAGEARPVVLPHAEWQLYERQREWYGRVWDWYTVEGPFVRERDGRYYCFYSGGAWQERNYGVSYVISESPSGPFERECADDVEGPEIMNTRQGRVIGPGHASIVRAPDNVGEHLVYHAWDTGRTRRLMRVDRLDWGEEGPSSPAPTLEPQPAPPLPAFFDAFDGPDGAPPDRAGWRTGGGIWLRRAGELLQCEAEARPAAAAVRGVSPGTAYLLEANARLVEAADERGCYGVFFGGAAGGARGRTYLGLAAGGSELLWFRESGGRRRAASEALEPGFRPGAYHRLTVVVRGGVAEARVDGVRAGPATRVPSGGLGLFTWGVGAAFDGVGLTALGSTDGGASKDS